MICKCSRLFRKIYIFRPLGTGIESPIPARRDESSANLHVSEVQATGARHFWLTKRARSGSSLIFPMFYAYAEELTFGEGIAMMRTRRFVIVDIGDLTALRELPRGVSALFYRYKWKVAFYSSNATSSCKLKKERSA